MTNEELLEQLKLTWENLDLDELQEEYARLIEKHTRIVTGEEGEEDEDEEFAWELGRELYQFIYDRLEQLEPDPVKQKELKDEFDEFADNVHEAAQQVRDHFFTDPLEPEWAKAINNFFKELGFGGTTPTPSPTASPVTDDEFDLFSLLQGAFDQIIGLFGFGDRDAGDIGEIPTLTVDPIVIEVGDYSLIIDAQDFEAALEQLAEVLTDITTRIQDITTNPAFVDPITGERDLTEDQKAEIESLNEMRETLLEQFTTMTQTLFPRESPTALVTDKPGAPRLGFGDRMLFSLLQGVALGIREAAGTLVRSFADIARTFGRALQRATDLLTRSLTDLVGSMFDIRMAEEANRSRNLEKFVQAQSTSLLRKSTEDARTYAREIMLGLEDAMQQFGVTSREAEQAAITASMTIEAIPDRLGMTEREFATFIAQAEAAAFDLSAGLGMSISEIVQNIMTQSFTNEELARLGTTDPIISRMLDPTKGRAITGNPVADMRTLFQVLEELDAEIDFSELVQNNPRRLIQQFEAKMFAPRTGLFGWLQDFRLEDITTPETLVIDTTLLDQFNTLLDTALDKWAEFIITFAERLSGISGLEPVEAAGLLLNRLAGFIQGINISNLLDLGQSFIEFLGRIFSQENLENINTTLDTWATKLSDFANMLEEKGQLVSIALGALVGYMIGGLPGAFFGGAVAGGGDLETGLTTAVGGTLLVATIGQVTQSLLTGVFVNLTQSLMAGGGIFAGLKTVLTGAVIPALQTFALGLTTGFKILFGGLMAILSPLLLPLLGILGGLVVGLGLFLAWVKLTGRDVGKALRDLRDGFRMVTDALTEWVRDLPIIGGLFGGAGRETAGTIAYNSTVENNITSTTATEAADLTIPLTTLSADELQSLLQGGTPIARFEGANNIQLARLTNNLFEGLQREERAEPGEDSYLATLNTGEIVLNRDQIAELPQLVTDRFQNASPAEETAPAIQSVVTNTFLNNTGLTPVAEPAVGRELALTGAGGTTTNQTVNSSPSISVTITPGMDASSEEIAQQVIQRLNDYYENQARMKFFA